LAKTGLKDVPKSAPLAYPEVGFSASPNARPVKVLGIGDSYYRFFTYLGVSHYSFADGEYWYYYNSIVPETKEKKEVWEVDLKSKLEENEVVIVMYNAGNLFRLGDGFFDDAYLLYTNPKSYYAKVQKERPIKEQKKIIHNSPELLEEVTLKAKTLNISVDSAISLKANELLGGKGY
jgi:hypothetical protein